MPNNNGILTKPISIGDVQTVLNISSSDLGTICRSNRINMYSAYKPMRWGNPCDIVDASTGQDMRHMLNYGLLAHNSDVDLKYNVQSQNPYWTYEPPRGSAYNEWFRLLDFDRYDHNALCPVKPLSVSSQMRTTGFAFQLDLENVFEPESEHLQITLNMFPTVYSQESSFFGVCVWNKTKSVGYYLTTKYTLRQVVNQSFDSYASLSVGFDGINEFSGGDECELFYCCSSTCTEDMPGEDEGTIVWVKARYTGEVQLIAPDSTHGHADFVLIGFNLMDSIGFVWVTNRVPEVSSNYNTQQARYEVTSLYIRSIQCNYSNWRDDGTDGVWVYFSATVDGRTLGSTHMYLNTIYADHWVHELNSDGVRINGNVPIDEDIMRSDDPTVAIKVYVRQDGQSTEYELGGFTYDVLRQEVSYP